jgi:hypothetical protein
MIVLLASLPDWWPNTQAAGQSHDHPCITPRVKWHLLSSPDLYGERMAAAISGTR